MPVPGPRSLRVLRLTPYYFLPERRLTDREMQFEPVGGMQIQITMLTEAMDARGVEQTVLLPARCRLYGTQRRGRDIRLRFLPVPSLGLRTKGKGRLGLLPGWAAAAGCWLALRRLRPGRGASGCDLVHVHCSELPWSWLAALAAKCLARRPTLLTVHCSAIGTWQRPARAHARLLRAWAMRCEAAAVRRADAVIVLTDRLRRTYLGQRLCAEDRIVVIPDVVDSRFRPAHPPAPPVGGSPNGDPLRVLYAGRFAPEKGWRCVVEAARRLRTSAAEHPSSPSAPSVPSVAFELYGDGNERAQCLALVRRWSLRQWVKVPGFVDRDTMADTMARADVVVVPSLHEELGGTLLEALSLGKPVVASAVGGVPEVLDHGRAGILVPPGDADALASALLRLAARPCTRQALGEQALARAAAYATERSTRRLHALYRSLVRSL